MRMAINYIVFPVEKCPNMESYNLCQDSSSTLINVFLLWQAHLLLSVSIQCLVAPITDQALTVLGAVSTQRFRCQKAYN